MDAAGCLTVDFETLEDLVAGPIMIPVGESCCLLAPVFAAVVAVVTLEDGTVLDGGPMTAAFVVEGDGDA